MFNSGSSILMNSHEWQWLPYIRHHNNCSRSWKFQIESKRVFSPSKQFHCLIFTRYLPSGENIVLACVSQHAHHPYLQVRIQWLLTGTYIRLASCQSSRMSSPLSTLDVSWTWRPLPCTHEMQSTTPSVSQRQSFESRILKLQHWYLPQAKWFALERRARILLNWRQRRYVEFAPVAEYLPLICWVNDCI